MASAPIIQRACACGGGAQCRCHEDEDRIRRAGVQPRLIIGEVDDEYEREAEWTASRVTQDPSANAHRQHSESLPTIRPYVQRSSASRSDERAAPDTALESRLAKAEGFGTPLHAAMRLAYEQQFGTDFSSVRVHNDTLAHRLTDDVGALAFTHGRDIYFGQGQYRPESTDGQHLLAHELTHVVQQAGGSSGGAVAQRRPRVVQRAPLVETKLYYFGLSGKTVHEAIESRLLAHKPNASLMVEAPIPGGTRKELFSQSRLDDFERVGRADLYTSSDSASGAAVGVRGRYDDHDLTVDPQQRTRHYVPFFTGGTMAAAGKVKWQPSAAADKIRGSFPTSFQVGDLKPLAVTKAGEGVAQIGNYVEGLPNFVDQAKSDRATTQTGSTSGAPLTNLPIPDGLNYRTIDSEGGKPGPGAFIVGARRYWLAPGKDNGLYFYFDLPHPAPSKAAREKLDKVVAALAPVKEGLAIPHQGPDSKLDLKRRSPAASRRVIQRQPAPAKPDWDAKGAAWEEQRSKWDRDVAKPFLRTTEAKYLDERIVAENHLSGDAIPPAGAIDVKGFKSVELWSGLTGRFLGALRFKFGNTFDKIVGFYQKIRERFKGMHARVKSLSSETLSVGWQKKLVGLLLKALKIGFVELLKSLFAFFANCVQGIINKVIRKFTEDISEELRTYLEELHQKFEEYSNRFKEEFESRFGRWDEFISDLSEVAKWAQIASDLITMIRLGVQVISCLSPPALGCLWGIVVQFTVESGLNLVAGTAWFDRNIVRPTVRNLIRRFAGPAFQGLLDDALDLVGLTEFASDVRECHEGNDPDKLADRAVGAIPQEGLDGSDLIAHRDRWYEQNATEIKQAQKRAGSDTSPGPTLEEESKKSQQAIRVHLGWPEQKASDEMWRTLYPMRDQLVDNKGDPLSSGEISSLADEAAKDGLTPKRLKDAVQSAPVQANGKRKASDVKEQIAKAAQQAAQTSVGPESRRPVGVPPLSIRKWYNLPDTRGPVEVGPQVFQPPPGQPEKEPTVVPGIKGSF